MPVPAPDLYDEHASEYDADTSFEDLPDALQDLLASFVDALPGPRVLDAGCGPGRDTEYFHDRGLEPVGVDLARGMVERGRERRPGQYCLMDVRDLAVADDSVDGVWCPATVFFVPPDGMKAALGEFVRALQPDGVARIGFKLGDGPTAVEKYGETTVEYHVSEDEARSLLAGAGFGVRSVSVEEVSPQRTFANFLCSLED